MRGSAQQDLPAGCSWGNLSISLAVIQHKRSFGGDSAVFGGEKHLPSRVGSLPACCNKEFRNVVAVTYNLAEDAWNFTYN